LQEKVCKIIEERFQAIQTRLPSDLDSIPKELTELEAIDGYLISFCTSKHPQEDGSTIIVIQAFVHTLAWPTFISFNGIGKLYAEGIVLSRDGHIETAQKELMWQFR